MTEHPSVLVVDDDPCIRDSCGEVLGLEGFEVWSAKDGPSALDEASERTFDLVILDLRLPGMGGLEVLERLTASASGSVVVVVTALGTMDNAVEAMRRGAHDFLCKPFTPSDLRHAARRCLAARGRGRPCRSKRGGGGAPEPDRPALPALVGSSKAIREVRRLVAQVAPSDCTVLLLGETGTGKELVARQIHARSPRRSGPMLAVDCGCIVESLFESELFGHSRGAFTGAFTTRIGRFEAANGGTLFLDEVANISREVQAKLLRAVQEREVTAVGSTTPVKVDVRIVAATNRDLLADVEAGVFREDLFYRLGVVPIELPPLRDRLEDIPALTEHLLRDAAARRGRLAPALHAAALERLTLHDWPGNVRELESVIDRALVLGSGPELKVEDITFFCPARAAARGGALLSLSTVEADHVRRVLSATGGHIGRSAAILGIDRKTLRMKVRRLGLQPVDGGVDGADFPVDGAD